jgi:glycosyltransferase involved in cell wall biosynthesis
MKKIKNHKVSIIVSIFNVDRFLTKTISSILAQSHKNFELLLIDSNSEDKSGEICKSFEMIDKRVRYLKVDNNGLVSSRKTGLSHCTSKYICFIDGDDWIEKDYILLLLESLTTHKSDLSICSHFKDLNENSIIVYNKFKLIVYGKKSLIKYIYPSMISGKNFFTHGVPTYLWGKLFKTRIVKKIMPLINNSILVGEDASLVYPYLLKSKKVSIVKEALYHYVQHNNSILKTSSNQTEELLRLNLLKHHLTAFLLPSNKVPNLKSQLEDYMKSLIVIRTGGILKVPYSIKTFFNKDFYNKRIVIFSSGSFGKLLYKKIVELNYANIVLWIDEDYLHDRNMGMDVRALENIRNVVFDYILIATTYLKEINQIIKKLSYYNNVKDKVVTIDYDKIDLAFINEN